MGRVLSIKRNDDIAGTRWHFYHADEDGERWPIGDAGMSNLGDWEGRFDTKNVSFSNLAELRAWAARHGYGELEAVDECAYGASLDNGATFRAADGFDAAELAQVWDALVEAMEPHVREAVHSDLAPCSHGEFLAEYLRRMGLLVIG